MSTAWPDYRKTKLYNMFILLFCVAVFPRAIFHDESAKKFIVFNNFGDTIFWKIITKFCDRNFFLRLIILALIYFMFLNLPQGDAWWKCSSDDRDGGAAGNSCWKCNSISSFQISLTFNERTPLKCFRDFRKISPRFFTHLTYQSDKNLLNDLARKFSTGPLRTWKFGSREKNYFSRFFIFLCGVRTPKQRRLIMKWTFIKTSFCRLIQAIFRELILFLVRRSFRSGWIGPKGNLAVHESNLSPPSLPIPTMNFKLNFC